MQQYKLGQYFRRRYGDLIGQKYSPNKVYIHSTDTDRTIMSALANLAGLFPPTDNEIWNENIPWQPIPIRTGPLIKKCPQFNAIYEKNIQETPEIQQIFTKYADDFLHWTRESGKNITTFDHVKALYKTLQMELLHKKALVIIY